MEHDRSLPPPSYKPIAMCGINGIIGADDHQARLIAANVAICHRGPDASSVWCNDLVGLGHVRLSIIDLSERSNQPFIKQGLVIAFNGEIYNYRELRGELRGVEFTTESDTEVILEAWRRWGIDSLRRLRGMFAFAIYDISSGETVIARDHFGIKPLFYREEPGQLLFSSELKGLAAMCSGPLAVSRAALAASLMYVWLPEEQCIMQGTSKLAPGGYLRVSPDGRVTKGRYWSASELLSVQPAWADETAAVSRLDAVLHESVRMHLVADVPVNAFLSGGLDSSLIVAMARSHLDALDCYTIRFADLDRRQQDAADDAYYAEKVAQHLGVRLHAIDVHPNLVELLPRIVHHLDEPIGDSAAINTLLICESARREGVKVLLSGMGADELFAGYRKHLANTLASRYRALPRALHRLLAWGLDHYPQMPQSKSRLLRWGKRFSSFADLPEADAFLRSYTYFSPEQLRAAFADDVSEDLQSMIAQHHETFFAARPRGLIDAMCYTDVNRFMTSLNLTYTDRASMAASTEVRVPFIDIEVAKAAFAIPEGLKIRGLTQKYILKRVAEKWLPREVIYRPKSSFTMPLRAWMKNGLSDLISDYLLSPTGLSGRGILKPEFVRRIVEEERAGLEDNAQVIWHLLTMEQWLRNHGI